MWCFSMRDKYAALELFLLDVYQVELVCMFLLFSLLHAWQWQREGVCRPGQTSVSPPQGRF